MPRKNLLSLFMLSMGAALLVAALAAGGSMAASKGGPGGTMRVGLFGGSVSYLDPQIAYDTGSWTVINATSMNLVGYNDSNGIRSPLQLQGALGFPSFRNSGKQITWKVKSGLKFNDGTPVTAASYQRSFERLLSPCMYGGGLGVADFFDKLIVGGVAYNTAACNPTAHITGVKATGQQLVINLTKPAPYLTAAMAMMWFTAVPANTPMDSFAQEDGASEFYPSAGPYYIDSANPLASVVITLKRNPFYTGPRLSNPNIIQFIQYGSQTTCYNDTVGGSPSVDVDLCGMTSALASQASTDYGASTVTGVPGAAAGGGTKFHVETTGCVDYLAFNTQKAPTNDLKVRKAIAWALDKGASPTSLLLSLGVFAGSHSGQILTPAIPGYKKFDIYGVPPNFPKAAAAAGGALNGKTLEVFHSSSGTRTAQALAFEATLASLSSTYGMGLTINDTSIPSSSYYSTLGNKAQATGPSGFNIARGGWCADYYDPFDYLNVLFHGGAITPLNGVNLSYSNFGPLNIKLNAASKLAGAARKTAYATLDKIIVRDYASVLPYALIGARIMTSNNVSNYTYNGFQTSPALNALSVN